MGQGIWLDSEKLGINDEIKRGLKARALSIGFIGLAETLKALVGAHHGESEEARNLGYEIVAHMRGAATSRPRKTGLNFTLLATPQRDFRADLLRWTERYGVIGA